ncbi:hypothetical protein BDN72DRAFT_862233 [Pluteus cervinus]|uniref:Uncharacterized protein n=1 Tax=Pluteus cervinus TaxID=181527 RepID=A0ACD3AC93_9AGAR|nr:hypothetical protein BDN72DRAFT_862233 [Pluteus cervinus]
MDNPWVHERGFVDSSVGPELQIQGQPHLNGQSDKWKVFVAGLTQSSMQKGYKSLIENDDPESVLINHRCQTKGVTRLNAESSRCQNAGHSNYSIPEGLASARGIWNAFGRVLDGTPYCGRIPGLVARVRESDCKIKLYVRESQDQLRHLLLRQSLGVLDGMQFLLRPELPYANFHQSVRLPLGGPYPFTANARFTFRKTVNGANRLPVKRRDGVEVNLDANALVGRDVDIIFVLLHRHLGFGRAKAVAHILQIVLV